jgi:hypothetical protein
MHSTLNTECVASVFCGETTTPKTTQESTAENFSIEDEVEGEILPAEEDVPDMSENFSIGDEEEEVKIEEIKPTEPAASATPPSEYEVKNEDPLPENPETNPEEVKISEPGVKSVEEISPVEPELKSSEDIVATSETEIKTQDEKILSPAET